MAGSSHIGLHRSKAPICTVGTRCHGLQSHLDLLVITVGTDYCSLGTHFTDSLPTISHLITYIFAHKWQTVLLTLMYTFVPWLEFPFSNYHLLSVIYKHKLFHQLICGYVFYGVISHRVKLSSPFSGI